MKKVYIVTVFAGLFLSGCGLITNQKDFGATKIGEAFRLEDYTPYYPWNGYIEMANASNAIVVVETGERKLKSAPTEDLSEMTVTIKEILEDKSQDTLAVGSEVTVLEPYWIDEIEQTYQTKGAYIPLEEGKTYTLFLEKINDDIYYIHGNRFGIYQEDKSLPIIGTEFETVEDLWEYSFVSSSEDINRVVIEERIYREIEQEIKERFYPDEEVESEITESVQESTELSEESTIAELEKTQIFGSGVKKAKQPVPVSLSNLEERSSQIVTARVLNIEQPGRYVGRTMGAEPASVRMEITEVHKGFYQKNQRVTVFDNWWMHWVYEDVEHLNIESGAVPLKPGEEYVFFLDVIEGSPENNPYIVDSGFGVYHQKMEGIVASQLDFETYEDIKDYTFLAVDEEAYNQYQSIRENVLTKYSQ